MELAPFEPSVARPLNLEAYAAGRR